MTTLTALFISASAHYQLPPNLLEAVCFVESSHNVHAVHHDDGGSDSLGICQIKYSTAQWLGFRGTEHQLMDPRINIHYAAKYLSYQIKRYGSIDRALVSYNRGNSKGLTRSEYSDKVNTQWRNLWNENKSRRLSAMYRQ